jgi:hypothetical protein
LFPIVGSDGSSISSGKGGTVIALKLSGIPRLADMMLEADRLSGEDMVESCEGDDDGDGGVRG